MKERFRNILSAFIPAAIAFLATLIVMRVYELLIVDRTSDATIANEILGSFFDLTFGLSVLAVLFLIFGLISLLAKGVAQVSLLVILSLTVVINFALIRYFSITNIPLSTDLFGYTWNDVQTTVSASGGLNVFNILLLIFFPTAFIALWMFFRKKSSGRELKPIVSYGLPAILILALVLQFNPKQENFQNDQHFYLASNKTQFLLSRIAGSQKKNGKIVFTANQYPFLHEVRYESSLAKYFNKGTQPPNIVFVIVEGLGGEFVGADASYRGFTPFLDSLSTKSLYWQNALSNAGRTFGVLPTLLGSLPYGKDGFMSYTDSIPNHQSLISLLKPYGYYSSFFYGGNPNFDNMDLFLEYQGTDLIIDETKFPPSFQKTEKNAQGFSWGYADADVFDYGLQLLNERDRSPRVDIYLTLSTHEPFRVPDLSFKDTFEQKLGQIPEPNREFYTQYRNIFECLLYTDAALKGLLERYKNINGFANTIFIITGDHRLIPIPQATKISRFHVPLIIYSPLLQQAQTFKSITTHSDVLPSILSLLRKQYNLSFPDSMSFISDSLSTKKEFYNDHHLALIRNKSETLDFLSGEHFLSEGRLYEIAPTMDLEPISDDDKRDELTHELELFQAKSEFACENNRISKVRHHVAPGFLFNDSEKALLTELALSGKKPDELFSQARSLAFDKKYEESRLIARYLLNKSPNYHDARILLARTFGWDGQYDTARYFLQQVLTRSAAYEDAFIALSDIEYWDGKHARSLEVVRNGLERNPGNHELLARKARALSILGKKKEATQIINEILANDPQHELSLDVQKRLK